MTTKRDPASKRPVLRRSISVEELRVLVSALKEEFEECEWFRGAGIGRDNQGLTLRLNVDPEFEDSDQVPRVYDGRPIEIVGISAYEPRKER